MHSNSPHSLSSLPCSSLIFFSLPLQLSFLGIWMLTHPTSLISSTSKVIPSWILFSSLPLPPQKICILNIPFHYHILTFLFTALQLVSSFHKPLSVDSTSSLSKSVFFFTFLHTPCSLLSSQL